jgi:hypothetical protein
MGSLKVPGMLAVLHCNGRTYGDAYLVTLARTHTGSSDRVTAGSTGRKLLFESPAVLPSHSI